MASFLLKNLIVLIVLGADLNVDIHDVNYQAPFPN
jgi:hypothetical protein